MRTKKALQMNTTRRQDDGSRVFKNIIATRSILWTLKWQNDEERTRKLIEERRGNTQTQEDAHKKMSMETNIFKSISFLVILNKF